jgi:hypothetical protein
MHYVKGDPYFLAARYDGTCFTCEEHIEKGSQILYWPKGGARKVQCETCGDKHYAKFQAECADETWQ